jgi:hypothetical protein
MAKAKPTNGPRKSKPSVKRGKPKTRGAAYQFKITLAGFKPAIWRRIQVEDCTLGKFHEYIQTSMGWSNSHLHRFQIGEKEYADPMLMEDDMEEFGYLDSTTIMLSEVLPKKQRRFRIVYEYDFGDSWFHEILFEGCKEAEVDRQYPMCVEGERACPPEDVGGVWGYADFLNAIGNKRNKSHKELLEWVGGNFDPDKFDPAQATKSMREGVSDEWLR